MDACGVASYSIPHTETYLVESPTSGQGYQVAVALPRSYREGGRQYPILYALDANAGFGTLVEGHRMMSLRKGIPDVILAGVGYPVEDFAETLEVRRRDLTPTPDRDDDPESPCGEEAPRSGQADEFLRFLREDLFPAVEGRYRVDCGDRGILGVSFGGLFAAYVLLTSPSTFRRYIIGSPSLWWDDEVLFDLAEAAQDLDYNGVRVFLSVGAEEEDSVVRDVRRLAGLLQTGGLGRLRLTCCIFEGETHLSVGGATTWRGLREVYGPDGD
jgi:predicted alpha/beta superfamily hydrolase